MFRFPFRFQTFVRWLTAVACVCALFLLTRCGQQSTTTTVSGTFTDVYTNTLSTDCVSCHNPTNGAATLDNNTTIDFSSQSQAYTTLTAGVVAGMVKAPTCGGLQLVVASNPTNSYVLATMFSTYNTANFAGKNGCTPYNHANYGNFNLSAAEQTSIVNWIQNGAQNN